MSMLGKHNYTQKPLTDKQQQDILNPKTCVSVCGPVSVCACVCVRVGGCACVHI
jgi:hypothetical protein